MYVNIGTVAKAQFTRINMDIHINISVPAVRRWQIDWCVPALAGIVLMILSECISLCRCVQHVCRGLHRYDGFRLLCIFCNDFSCAHCIIRQMNTLMMTISINFWLMTPLSLYTIVTVYFTLHFPIDKSHLLCLIYNFFECRNSIRLLLSVLGWSRCSRCTHFIFSICDCLYSSRCLS